jgi:hypothetical protein
MSGRSEGPADKTKHHLQEVQGIDHTSLIGHPSSQPSFDISPLWTPIITAEVRKLQLRPYVKVVFLCWYCTENLPL